MSHPEIKNKTPFSFESLFLMNEQGRQLLTPLVKATYQIINGQGIALADEQLPVNPAGQYWSDPDKSSYKYEPETAFYKPATDIVLIGHACAPKSGVTSLNVGLNVGPLKKVIRITGDRYWVKTLGIVTMTKPKPFERISLVYERAFGGWDRSHKDPNRHTFEPRNPVGTGFRNKNGKFEEGIKLPNLEDPRRPLKSFKDKPRVAGFGFISPHWQPRDALAGTYDAAWMKAKMPLLPTDFDMRFFNAAPADQIAPGYLRSDLPVMIQNASPNGLIRFSLPGVAPPQCSVELRGNAKHELKTNLDTVIINTDESLVFLIWRTNLILRNGPQDVVAIKIWSEGLSAPAQQQ